MSHSKALTKIQAIILVAVIVVASVIGGAAYVLLSGQDVSSETIKIGVCADLDGGIGKMVWQCAVLAVEQINAEGGLLGRNLEVVAEDDDSESTSADFAVATNAMTRLITVDKADFIISGAGPFSSLYQETVAQHSKILIDCYGTRDEYTEKVLDDYDRYKYYFKAGFPNDTTGLEMGNAALSVCREHTGFNKVALMCHDWLGTNGFSPYVDSLEELGFEVVSTISIPFETVDFSSYFVQAEAAGAEIIASLGIFGPPSVAFVKEYQTRQSPTVIWGWISIAQKPDFWEMTDGACEFISVNAVATEVEYPLTNKTLPYVEAYRERWGEPISGGVPYDAVRYILADAIRRAGTIETEAVIKALESTDIETAGVRRFVYTSSHDIMVKDPNRPDEDFLMATLFQWQDGVQVPVYPKSIMEEAEVTYAYPPWPGPWD